MWLARVAGAADCRAAEGRQWVIGLISVTRKEPGICRQGRRTVRTFADQAVIAIQNVELFEEVQAQDAGA